MRPSNRRHCSANVKRAVVSWIYPIQYCRRACAWVCVASLSHFFAALASYSRGPELSWSSGDSASQIQNAKPRTRDHSSSIESAVTCKPIDPWRTRCRHRSLGRSIHSYSPLMGTISTSCAFPNRGAIKFHQTRSAGLWLCGLESVAQSAHKGCRGTAWRGGL